LCANDLSVFYKNKNKPESMKKFYTTKSQKQIRVSHYLFRLPALISTTAFATAFAVLLIGHPLFAQQSYALRPYSVTLPRLSTAQQSTSATQQAGNIIYNTEEQKVAFHNGSTWQYVATNAPEASEFKNKKQFISTTTWIVPAGVTRILAEVWGGGGGGGKAVFTGTLLSAAGGGSGSYGRGFMTVVPGNTLTLTIGLGGSGANTSVLANSGGSSQITSPTEFILTGGGDAYGNPGYIPSGVVSFGIGGGGGSNATISYGQKSATEFIQIVDCGDGGTAYGAQQAGFGAQFSLLNSSSLLYTTDEYYVQKGGFPGGGGGAGYASGGRGGDGMIIIHS